MLAADYFSLAGKKGLVLGIANQQSIAYGCARAFRTLGADLAVTYLNHKARPHVQPAADTLGAALFLPCDVTKDGELEAVFAAIEQQWGRLDFALHAIAFAPREDLHGRLTDSSSAASGLKDFDQLLAHCEQTAPLQRLASIDDVGAVAAMLATRSGAMLTGQTIYVDGGYHLMG